MLFDIRAGEWSEELCRLLDVPMEVLPEVRSSSEVYGEATVAPLRGTPIAGIAGDQQAALFGQRCGERGLAKCTYGTGCFLLLHVGDAPAVSRNRLLSTVAWRIGDRTEYALEGSVFVGGAVVQWLRDGLGIISDSAQVEALALSVPSSEGVVFVPAFAGLGAPHWDPHARGAILGLTRGSTRAHVARAALESIALQVKDLVAAMEQDFGSRLAELRVDGGAARNDLLMQLQADLLGIPVVRPAVTESTALGAAYLAGLAVGVWRSRESLAAAAAIDRTFEPQERADIAPLVARWRRAVERAKGWEETPRPEKPARARRRSKKSR
jgi:glycerol kinase